MGLRELNEALKATGIPTHHFEAVNQPCPYIVWAEEGQGETISADDKVLQQSIAGSVEYFTKTEYDPAFCAIQDALNELDVSWQLVSIRYDQEAEYIQYRWTWEAVMWPRCG